MTTLTAVPTQPRRIGALDLVWLTWRQHRGAIITGAVLVAALYALGTVIGSGGMPNYATCTGHCGEYSIFGLLWIPGWTMADILSWLATGFALIIGVFWAAPLLAREYDQRTTVLAWGQDVSVLRWLFAKIAVLGVIAVGYATVTALAVRTAIAPFHQIITERDDFESAVPVQVAYVLCAFLLGVAVSAFVRRTVPAMGITMAVFVIVRFVAYELRFTYLPALHLAVPVPASGNFSFTVPPNVWQDFGSDNLVGGHHFWIISYQPADRLTTFRLIEIGIFVGLTVILAVVTWLRMRPTRTSVPAPGR